MVEVFQSGVSGMKRLQMGVGVSVKWFYWVEIGDLVFQGMPNQVTVNLVFGAR